MEYEEQENDRPITNQNYQTPMSQSGSNILYLTNPEGIIQEMVLTLRGQSKDDNGNTIQTGRRLMNEEGINMAISSVRSASNQVTVMSNLDENEIKAIIMDLSDNVIAVLMIKKKEYGIADDSDRSFIRGLISRYSYIAMKRAIIGTGNEKQFWKGSVQDINYNTKTNEKKGIFDMLGKWGK